MPSQLILHIFYKETQPYTGRVSFFMAGCVDFNFHHQDKPGEYLYLHLLNVIAMKRYLLFIVMFFAFLQLPGQDSADTIRMVKQGGNLKFYKGKQECTFMELSEFLKPDPEAYKFYKQAKVSRSFSGIIFGIGFITTCYGVLYGVSQGVEQEDPSLIWSGLIAGVVVGGGIMALSIPVKKAYKQHIGKAIKCYNDGLLQSEVTPAHLRAGITQNGITLAICF